MTVDPVVLEGRWVRLEPLSQDHLDRIREAGSDPELWRFIPGDASTAEGMDAWFEEALRSKEEGRALPFATVERVSGRVVGSTRFAAIERAHRRVEIGWTWVASPWQRTAINTEAKYLMLRHAFERWACMRVELKTDRLNERSRRAILRIGASEEGVLRHHMILRSGRMRDTVYYSILREEWPAVKARLETMLARGEVDQAGAPGVRVDGDAPELTRGDG